MRIAGIPAKPLVLVGSAALVGFLVFALPKMLSPKPGPSASSAHSESRPAPRKSPNEPPTYLKYSANKFARDHSFNKNAILVLGGKSEHTNKLHQYLTASNIRPSDYAGAQACANCHEDNHALWSKHAHRLMNAQATEETVLGNFAGGAASQISYRGGTASFYREQGRYVMKLARDGIERVFEVNRTIGSRIHQYYVGTLRDGPEPADHRFRAEDHVLPFGFELTRKQWLPIVHVTGHMGSDDMRDDPFVIPSQVPYDSGCSTCHTTPPMGNQMLVMYSRFGAYSPRDIHFDATNYLEENFPGAVHVPMKKGEQPTKEHLRSLNDQFERLLNEENAVNLGISCEACHLGAKAHAENEKILPAFYPAGPHVHAQGSSKEDIWGRNTENKNFTCARCHSGERPLFAAGISTWNSTEYTDAMRGHCYHPDKAKARGMKSLACVNCHDPHETIGRRWTRTPAQDNASCLKCHEQFREPAALQAHTHHLPASEGSECMNCHMPRINEGMGDLVRTHTIFSPTEVSMLESNQPNACNMCHLDKSIDWTLGNLEAWYGLASRGVVEVGQNTHAKSYSDYAINQNYPNREQPVPVGWLKSSHYPTRLVGADVLIKGKARWALPEILPILDDPYMEIRQFTTQRLEDYLQIYPENYGYRIQMTAEERKEPMRKIMEAHARGR